MRLAYAPVSGLVFGLVLFTASLAAAATVEVRDAWIRTPPPGAPTAAGYATVTNHGISSDRLTGAYSGGAASVGLHQMSMAGGVMRMRPITGGLPIGASASVSLTPNGDHLMLTGLKAPLKAGQHVKIVLQFQRAGNVAADFVVRDAGPGGMHM
jgi:periplasmic copper chaperone A